MNPLKSHPNAVISGGSGGLGFLLVWALNRWTGAAIDGETGALIATAATTVALFIGREGIRGAVKRLWSGEARSQTDVTVSVAQTEGEPAEVTVAATGTPSAPAPTALVGPAPRAKRKPKAGG